MIKSQRAIVLGVSLLFAASALGFYPTAVSNASDNVGSQDVQIIAEPEEPKDEPPKLKDNEEFLSLVNKLNPNIDENTTVRIANSIEENALEYALPESVLISMIAAESNFRPDLKGSLDDSGLMQIRFRYSSYWANQMGITPPNNMGELSNIETNIKMGAFILKSLTDRYGGNIHYALVAYNCGNTYVDKKLKNNLALPQSYLKKINQYHLEYAKEPLTIMAY